MPREMLMIIKPKSGPSYRKDGDDDDDDMTDSISCPVCGSASNVVPIATHSQIQPSPVQCCLSCRYAWPGDAPTPQETPARP